LVVLVVAVEVALMLALAQGLVVELAELADGKAERVLLVR
jgi:hypothetical protein